MAKSFSGIIGMMQELFAYMNDAENVAKLAAKGLDIVPLRTRLQTKMTAITQKNADQEQAKVAVLNLTNELNPMTDDGYADASSMIDAMIGMLGKNTPEAKNLQLIRTGFGPGAPTPPTPPTPPGPGP